MSFLIRTAALVVSGSVAAAVCAIGVGIIYCSFTGRKITIGVNVSKM